MTSATAPSGTSRNGLRAQKWARLRRAGAQGLRRGAWYPVVSESSETIVVVDVNKRMVPVPRSMLVFSDTRPAKWTVVQWAEHERGAQRASESELGLTYAVCPACRYRSSILPPDAPRLVCARCGGDFALDWDNPG